MWITMGVSTSVPWPQEEQIVVFNDVEIEILPESKDTMPMVRVHLSNYGMDMDQGREFLNKFFSSLSWSKKGFIQEELSLGTGVKGGRIGKGPQFSVTTSRFDDDYMPTGLNEKQSLALAIYREAQAINNTSYKYLGYFKILNIGNQYGRDHKDWINNNLGKIKGINSLATLKKLQSEHSDIGEYLYASGRCAVAHAFDQSTLVNPDKTQDIRRLSTELDLIQELAELFIEHELGIKSRSTFYKEHLYELDGVKKMFTQDQIDKIINNDRSVLSTITNLPKFSIGEQHSKVYPTFEGMEVTAIDLNSGGLICELTDRRQTLSVLVYFNFKEERLGWDLFDKVAIIPTETSVSLYESLIDLTKFKIEMIRNGRFSIYNTETGILLGRTDANIPVNIDLTRTIDNFHKQIQNFDQEIKKLEESAE